MENELRWEGCNQKGGSLVSLCTWQFFIDGSGAAWRASLSGGVAQTYRPEL